MTYPIQIVGSKAYNWFGKDWDAQIMALLPYSESLDIQSIINSHAAFMRRMGCEGELDLWVICTSPNSLVAVKSNNDGTHKVLPYKHFPCTYCL